MTRAERRRQARMQEKCQVPLNLNLTVAQVAGMTGQQASILQTYLKRMEQQTTEAATDAVIREAQEKLERAKERMESFKPRMGETTEKANIG
jgi:hypothetical protein